MGESEGRMETLSTSPSNCARILSRVISVLKREGGEEESTSTFYLSGFPVLVLAFFEAFGLYLVCGFSELVESVTTPQKEPSSSIARK